MVPPATGERKMLKEYEPPTVVLRHLTWGGIVFLSGVTDMTHMTLDEQFPVIIGRLSNRSPTPTCRGTRWRARHSSCIATKRCRTCASASPRRSVREFLRSSTRLLNSRQGKRLEIELTAKLA